MRPSGGARCASSPSGCSAARRELTARIEREEAEALRRIQSSFGDVERRQVEQLERVVERDGGALLGARGASSSRRRCASAREDAAQRLARELDRAVQAFAREATAC